MIALRGLTGKSLGIKALVSLALLAILGGMFTAPAAKAVSGKYAVDVSNIGGYNRYPLVYLSLPQVRVENGYMYFPGVTTMQYPGPLVQPVEKRSVKKAELTKAVEALYDAAEAPSSTYSMFPISDAPMTYIRVTTPKGTRNVTVYLPTISTDGFEGSGWGPRPGEIEARAKLRLALATLEGLQGRSSVYRPSKFEFWPGTESAPVREGSVTLKLVAKPSATSMPGCFVLSSSGIPKGANSASLFKMRDGSVIEPFMRAVLPGEEPCKRVNR
jgi:hypothetical protein